MAEQQGGSSNYAAKIKNIETKLRHANEKMEEMKKQRNTLTAKIAGEADHVLKAKMTEQKTSIAGGIQKQQKDIDEAKAAMKKIEAEQQEQIKDVVKGVVLSEDTEQKAETEGAVADAKK